MAAPSRSPLKPPLGRAMADAAPRGLGCSWWGAARLAAVAAISSFITSMIHHHNCFQSEQLRVHELDSDPRAHLQQGQPKHAPARMQPTLFPNTYGHQLALGDRQHWEKAEEGAILPPSRALSDQLKRLPVFIIGLDQPEAHRNIDRLGNLLRQHGLHNVQWWNATDGRFGLYNSDGIHFKTYGRSLAPGELGVRDSFRRLLLHAWQEGIERFIALEDDVTPHCNLRSRLVHFLYENSCGAWGDPDSNGGPPGLFMLGATCYAITDRRVFPPGTIENGTCYRATRATYGAFALMFRRDSIPGILRWLHHSALPWDNVFGLLNEKPGFHVPVAYPNLFAPELFHNSSTQPWKVWKAEEVQRRYKQHAWDRDAYCGWAYQVGPKSSWQRPAELSPPHQGSVFTVSQAAERGAEGMRALMSSLRQGYDSSGAPFATLPTVILTLDPSGGRVARLMRALQAHGLHNLGIWTGTDARKIWGGDGDLAWDKKTNLRPGELGVLQSHRDILKAAWFEGLQRVLILEDDAIPHCRLQEKLLEALEDDACGALTLGRGPQEAAGQGGVLMLGATEYSKWPGLLEEIGGGNGEKPRRCYSCNQGTYGAFAVVYSRTAIPYILRWMEEVKRAYDNQWDFLRLKGIKVKVMYPNLFMPDLSHKSLTDPSKKFSDEVLATRMRNHKWEPSNYCYAPGEREVGTEAVEEMDPFFSSLEGTIDY